VGSVEEVGAGVIEHGAPTGHGGEDADAEKTEGGFGEDGAGHGDGGLDEDGLKDVGNEMAEENAKVGGAERAGGEDEFRFADLENLGAGETRVAGPSGDDEGEDDFADARAEEGGKGNGEKNSGKREKGVDEDDVDEAVEPATEVARHGTDGKAGEACAQDNGNADEQGDARAEEDAGENIAAEIVGAHPVRGRGRGETGGKILSGGAGRGNERGEESEED